MKKLILTLFFAGFYILIPFLMSATASEKLDYVKARQQNAEQSLVSDAFNPEATFNSILKN